AQWAGLLSVQPSVSTANGSQVQIQRDQVGTLGAGTVIVDGKAGTVNDFSYAFGTNAVTQAVAGDAVTVLGRAGAADVLVATENASEGGSGRRMSQFFSVANGADSDSLTERKHLFQNAVWWLLNCKLCSNLNLHPEGTSSPDGLIAGGILTYNI